MTLDTIHHLSPFFVAAIALVFTALFSYGVALGIKERDGEMVFWHGVCLLGCLAMWPLMIPTLVTAWAALGGN